MVKKDFQEMINSSNQSDAESNKAVVLTFMWKSLKELFRLVNMESMTALYIQKILFKPDRFDYEYWATGYCLNRIHNVSVCLRESVRRKRVERVYFYARCKHIFQCKKRSGLSRSGLSSI